jgi:hypothetical protein
MKRVLIVALAVVIGFVSQSSAGELSAQKVIDRYRKATGGGALKRIKSTVITGALKTVDGVEGRFSLRATWPDRIRLDIEAGSLRVTECYNGKSAWRIDTRGLRTLLGQEARRLRLLTLLTNSRLADISKNRIIAHPPVKTSIDGREANSIEFVKDEARVKLFFDAASSLIVKQEQITSEGLEEMYFSNHRPIDGVMEAFSIKIKSGAGELQISVERIEHNRAADETAFRFPRVEGSRPLPDIEALMKTVVANQEKVEEMVDHFTFRLTEVEMKLDGGGKVKETETRVYEVTPIGKRTVERLISINGRELSAQEKEKEDRRIQKEVERIIREKEKALEKKESGQGDDRDEDRVSILDFLRISEVTSVRWETFRGHEVIAFDFEPRKGFKPRNRVENIVSKLAGTVWVDAAARQIARLEARLTDSFKLGGGLLASIAPSTAFIFEQEKIDNEIWLPSYGEANISARVLLFAKFNRYLERRYSDYKKYKIDSEYEIQKLQEVKKPDPR